MKKIAFGPLGTTSQLSLGGGGIGGYWGTVTRDEAVATLHHAVDRGIDLVDTAPGYGVCEDVLAEAFNGVPPEGIRFTTKMWFGSEDTGPALPILRQSLVRSRRKTRLPRFNVLFLHNGIVADDKATPGGAIGLTRYTDDIAPALQSLVESGEIDAWAITAASGSLANLAAFAAAPRPHIAQCVTNLLGSAGEMTPDGIELPHRSIVDAASDNDIAVMGMRILQAGALAASVDRALPADDPVSRDRQRAAAFLAHCQSEKVDPSWLAHRYALSIPSVRTIISGAKSRTELDVAIEAVAAGRLETDEMAAIDGLVAAQMP